MFHAYPRKSFITLTWKLIVFARRWSVYQGSVVLVVQDVLTVSLPFKALSPCLFSPTHMYTCSCACQAITSFWLSFCFLTAGFFSLSSLIFFFFNKCQPFFQLSLFLLLFLCVIFHPLPLLLPLAPFLFLIFYQYCHQFSMCKTFPLMTSLLTMYDF